MILKRSTSTPSSTKIDPGFAQIIINCMCAKISVNENRIYLCLKCSLEGLSKPAQCCGLKACCTPAHAFKQYSTYLHVDLEVEDADHQRYELDRITDKKTHSHIYKISS